MRASTERILLLAIFAAGLFLRWWRLDLITFRYDQAEALFRARETLRTGLPFTGIINSLGFRNGPGFIWALLPAALVTPRPDIIAGWLGFLTLTGLWPLWRVARRLCGAGWWVPCLLFAVMPAQVFAARSLWAQWLLPPMAMWVMLWLLVALDETTPTRKRYWAIAGALAMTVAAAGVHLAALLYVALLVLAIPVLFYWIGRHRSGRELSGTAGVDFKGVALWMMVGLMPGAMLIPSAVDYFRVRAQPVAEKAAHIEKFESLMPDPRPLLGRLQDAIGGQFGQFASLASVDGAWKLNESRVLRALVLVADLISVGAMLAGVALSLLWLRRGGGSAVAGRFVVLGMLLPALIGAVFVSRINATYLAMSLPILLLAAGWAVHAVRGIGHRILSGMIIAASIVHCVFTIAALQKIDSTRFVHGIYYIPVVDQQALAEQLAAKGVSAGRLSHLSGDWFQRPYEYLLREVLRAPELTRTPRWAVVEDRNLRLPQPARLEWIDTHATLWQKDVGAVVLQSLKTWDDLVREFYALPLN